MSNEDIAGPSTKPVKPPKQSKTPKPTQPDGEAKGKSAKELKKEKRAAAVAARGEAEGNDEVESTQAADQPRGRPTAHHTNGGPSTPKLSVPGPSAARRPPIAQAHSHITVETPGPSTPHQNDFFSHLPLHHPPSTSDAFNTTKLHPLIIRLGVLISSGALRGANARAMGTMAAFQEVIRDFECPDPATLWKDLQAHMSPMIAFLEECRPKGAGTGNAIRWLKSEMNRLGTIEEKSEAEAKDYLIKSIALYIRDRIEIADKVIADHAKEKIRAGDTVVTYARSSVVERVLLEAWRDMTSQDSNAVFHVVVVDSPPLNEGRNLLDTLISADIPCTYTSLSDLASVLPRCSLVLLGASALHADGALYSRAGTAMVAMLAKEYRVSVVACVETYKFSDKVVLDAVALNELGDPDLILSGHGQSDLLRDIKGVTPMSLMYDLTPPALITAVCTEIGFIPPSSVPTVLGKASGVA